MSLPTWNLWPLSYAGRHASDHDAALLPNKKSLELLGQAVTKLQLASSLVTRISITLGRAAVASIELNQSTAG